MTVSQGETPTTGRGEAGPTTESPFLWAGRVAGAALVVWMGWIHLHLWSEGYKHLPSIGPLFLANFIAAIVVALLLLGLSRPGFIVAVAAAGAALTLGTAGALALSVNTGLFGFTEAWSAPFTHLSVGVELSATVALFTTAAGLLVRSRRRG